MSGKKSRTLLKRRTRRPNKSLTPKDGRLFKGSPFFMSAAIASAITPYGGVHTYLSCKQAYFLNPLMSSSVPCRNSIRHKTAQTCRQSCFGREDYTSCGACRPTPGHGTGTRLKASAVPLCPAIYTPNLLPTIHIAVYTYRCIYSYTDIRLHTLHLRCLFYIHLYLSFHFRF